MSTGVKRALSNTVLQTANAIATTGLNFLLIFLYTKFLTQEDFGALVSSQAKVLIWMMLIDLGLYSGFIATLTIAERTPHLLSRGESHISIRLLSRITFLRLIGALIGAVAVIYLARISATEGETFYPQIFARDIAFIPALFAFALQQTVIAYAIYRNKVPLFVFSNLMGTLISIVLSAVLAYYGWPVEKLLFTQSLAGFFIFLFVFAGVMKERSWEHLLQAFHFANEKKLWRILLQNSWPYAIIFAVFVVWQRLDQIAAAQFFGFTSGGNYSLAARIVGIPVLIISSAALAIFPDFQRLGADAPEKLALYTGAILKFLFRYGFFICGILLLLIGYTLMFFFHKYVPARNLLPWFIPGVWAYCMYNISNGSLMGMKKYRQAAWAHIWALLIFLICLASIPFSVGLVGIAIASDAFCLALFAFTFRALRKSAVLPRHYSLMDPYSVEEAELGKMVKLRLMKQAKR